MKKSTYLILAIVLMAISVSLMAQTSELIPYRKGDKWGYCDRNKKIVIKPKYESADPFSDGLAWVQINDKWVLINREDKEITKCKYDFAWDFHEGLALVQKGKKFGFVNKEGLEVVACKYDEAEFF